MKNEFRKKFRKIIVKRIIPLFFLLILSASMFSQITLDLKGQQVKTILKKIESTSSFKFFYNEDLKGLDKVVSITLTNASLDEAMSQTLRETNIAYKRQENDIVLLTPKQADVVGTYVKITGAVFDDAALEIIGASVTVKGESIGTVTDVDGKFSLEVPPGATLVISFVGYVRQEVKVGKQTDFKIILKENAKILDEVVVVGYGTQKKVNLTGAVAVVTANDLKIKPVGQTSAALQGVLPGVTVIQRSGEPGSDGGTIRIRGVGTINGVNPLVMIDGVVGSMNNIDPNTIESISVLKDAASSSIYGSRAANGVILVTTKRGGGDGKYKISYSNYLGWQNPTNKPKMVDAVGYMELTNVAYENVGRNPLYTPELIEEFRNQNGVSSNRYPNTNWQSETLSKSGFQHNHFVNISGGSDKLKMFTSLGYFSQDGLIETSNFNRLSVRNNMDWVLSPQLKAKVDFQFISTKTTRPASSAGTIFQWMNSIPANQIGVNEDGSWGVGWNGNNPMAHAKVGGAHIARSPWGSINATVIYSPFSWLNAEVNTAPKYVVREDNNLTKPIQTYLPDGTPSFRVPSKSSLQESDTKELYNTVKATVTADKKIANHSFKLLLGAAQEEYEGKNITAFRDSVNVDYPVINTGSAANQRTAGSKSKWVLRSYFGRFNYDYKQRYLLEANLRHDGSSRFAKGNQWSTFPSVSAGWRIGEESFMAVAKEKFLDDLKIRVSWGKLGNQSIDDPYGFTTQMKFGVTAMDGKVIDRASFEDMPNSLLKWETTTATDIGIDLTMLNNKLTLTADYYSKKTKDILMQLPIPYTVGLSQPYQNAGIVENKGWELAIGYRDKVGDFNYGVTFNISDVKNKILDFKGQDGTGFITNREGHPINSIFGYIADGYFQSEEEIKSSPKQFGNVKPGDIKYKNLNDDDKIDINDKTIIGSTIPRYTYGLNLNASFKGFDLSALFQGVGKADGYLDGAGIIPFVNTGGVGGSLLEAFKDYWTEDNRDAKYPRLTFNESNNSQISTFWKKDASYLRLKNLQVGYTFPQKLTRKMFLDHLRVFVNGTNLFTIDNFWEGYNVEAPTGVVSFYPQVKVYSFGVELRF